MSKINAVGQLIYMHGVNRFAVEKLHRRDIVKFDDKIIEYADNTKDTVLFRALGDRQQLLVGKHVLNLINIPYAIYKLPSCYMDLSNKCLLVLSLCGDSVDGDLKCYTLLLRGMYYFGPGFYYNLTGIQQGWLIELNGEKFIVTIDGIDKMPIKCKPSTEPEFKSPCFDVKKVEITPGGLVALYILRTAINDYEPVVYNCTDVANITGAELSGNKMYPVRLTYRDGTSACIRLVSLSIDNPRHIIYQNDRGETLNPIEGAVYPTIHGTVLENSDCASYDEPIYNECFDIIEKIKGCKDSAKTVDSFMDMIQTQIKFEKLVNTA